MQNIKISYFEYLTSSFGGIEKKIYRPQHDEITIN